MRIEDSSMIYYRDTNGIVQDGNQWLYDFKHRVISAENLNKLVEVYWSANDQAWLIEG